MTDKALPATADALQEYLTYLKLPYSRENCETLARQAGEQGWSHADYLLKLMQGEAELRRDRGTQRRIASARFPVMKTLEQFNWTWPKKINRPQVQNLFRLRFVEEKANVVFLGGVGLGKTHLSTALAYTACLQGFSVLFATAVDIINTLSAAQATGQLKPAMKKYLSPQLLVLDELGYLPIDKQGADLLFQIISQRYEQGSIILTTNKVFKKWPEIFNNDSSITSAVLDRLLHHAETVVIEGASYRMKEQIEL
jgi:DNA replication protein DnaC